GSVVKFFVSVPRSQRRDGRIESRRVAEAGVEIAGGERAGHTAGRAGTRQGRAANRRGLALVLRPHFAGDVDFGPSNVRMHVDAARHDHEARGVENLVWLDFRYGWRRNDLVVLDPNILHDAVDTIGRVVYLTV